MHCQSSEKRRELFRTLDQAELRSRKVKQHSIVLLGLSRAGKSATMNWICNRQMMVGLRIGTNTFYVPKNSNTKNRQEALLAAKMGHTFASVTIMANDMTIVDKIQQSQKNPKGKKEIQTKIQASLVDFGGFGQRRQALQVIKVSYVLAAYFLKISKVKFILVVTQNAFNDISSNGLRDTLQQFLKLFDFDMMSQTEVEQFFEAISLCITSASRKYSQEIIVEQLEIIIKNFEDSSLMNEQGQNTYIEKFPMVKRLLRKLIQTKRFQLFALAQEGKQPTQSTIVNNFNNKNWKYFDLKKCRQSICYPYVQQFYKLKEEERKKIEQITLSKFSQFQTVNCIIKSMIEAIYKNLCAQDYDFKQHFIELEELVLKNTYYEDLKYVKIDENFRTKRITWLQRQDNLRAIMKICSQLHVYNVWMAQSVKQNKDDTRLARIIEYCKYLKDCFTRQMNLLQPLICKTSQEKLILNQIYFIIDKQFNEGLIFQKLNEYTRENCDLANTINVKLYMNSQLGNEFTDSQKSVRLKFIQSLSLKEINSRELNLAQVRQLIAQISRWSSELQVDIAVLYSICAKLFLVVAQQQQFQLTFQGRNNNLQALGFLLNGLQFCIKQHVCLEVVRDNQASGLLQQTKKEYIKRIVNIFLNINSKQSIQLGFQLCEALKQYSLTSSMFSTLTKKDPNNVVLLRRYAQFQKSVGNGNIAIQIYRSIRTIKPAELQLLSSQIMNQAVNNYRVALEYQQTEKSYVIPKEALVGFINKIRKVIFKQEQECRINYDQEKERYEQKIEHIVREKAYNRQFPSNPNNYQLLKNSYELIKLIEGRPVIKQSHSKQLSLPMKMTLLMSGSKLTGQTTLGYALSNKILAIKQGNPNYYYDLLDGGNDNKINNTGNNHTEYPHIRLVSDEQIILDLPCFFTEGIERKLIGSLLLQKCVESCRQFRLIFVMRQQDLLNNNGMQLINFFKLLLVLFNFDFNQSSNCLNVSNLVYLAVTFVNKNIAVQQKLKALSKNLLEKQKAVQNQQLYSIKAHQQIAIHTMLHNIIRKNRVLYFGLPNRDEKTFKKQNWFQQLQMDNVMDHQWKYMPSQQMVNISAKMFNKVLLQTEVESICNIVTTKLKTLKTIFKQMMFLAQQYYDSQLNNSKHTIDLTFNQLRELSGSLDQQRTEQVQFQLTPPQELLTSLYYLFEIKYYFVKDREYYLPQDYSEYYQLIEGFSKLLCQYLDSLCKTNIQRQIISNCHYNITMLLYELREYSIKLSPCEAQSIRACLNNIRQVQDYIQSEGGKAYIDKLQTVFFDKINFYDIVDDCSNETKERMLRFYGGILQIMGHKWEKEELSSYVSPQKWFELKREFNSQLVFFYKSQSGRKRQLLELRIRMIKQLCSSDYIFEQQQAIQDTNARKIDEIKDIFKEIAGEVVLSKPHLSKSICWFINVKETLRDIYQVIYQNQHTTEDKIATMVQRIVLAAQLEKTNKNINPRPLLRELHSLVTRNSPLYQQLATLQLVAHYAKVKGLGGGSQKRMLNGIDSARQYVEWLESEI